MTRSVLCALDVNQSTPHEQPLAVAADIAARDGATLDVVAVLPDLGYGQVASFLPADFADKARADTRARLDDLVDRVVGDKVAKVRRQVVVGPVSSEVLRVAAIAGSDLIVVGSHEPTVSDRLLGSNAAQIVMHAKVSVYVVR